MNRSGSSGGREWIGVGVIRDPPRDGVGDHPQGGGGGSPHTPRWRRAPSVSASRRHLPASGEEAPQREMGPTLRSTPLSPACGLRRSGELDAWRLDAGSDRPLRATEGRLLIARRSRRRRFRRGPGSIARTCPYRPAVPRPSRRPGSQAALTLPGGSVKSSTPGRQSGLPTLRPLSFNGLGFGWLQDEPLSFSASHSSTERHLAVVSLRFQNPFSVAGLSAFVSEGPIPVSMIGRCALQPIRASAGPSSYPLSA